MTTPSYAQELRDACFVLLEGLTYFNTRRKSPAVMIAPSDLPMLGVFILREERDADGDANTGEPQFIHRLTLGIAASVEIGSDEKSQLTLEQTMSDIEELLLTDPGFIKKFEGVVSMNRRQQYSKANETALADIQIEMVLQFRTRWQPKVPDDLEKVHLDTRYPDAASADKVLQTGFEADLTTT